MKTTRKQHSAVFQTKVVLEVWLKAEKWFWCDKEQYKAWKKEKKKDPR